MADELRTIDRRTLMRLLSSAGASATVVSARGTPFDDSVGEEAIAVGVMIVLDDDDYIASTHRDDSGYKRGPEVNGTPLIRSSREILPSRQRQAGVPANVLDRAGAGADVCRVIGPIIDRAGGVP